MRHLIKILDQEIYLPSSTRIQDLNTSISIQDPNFVKAFPGFEPSFSYALATRSFATNKLEYLQVCNNNNDSWQILDGFYSVATLDGYVFGFGDGCGGHLDAQEDKKIADAVRIVAKTAIEALLKYPSADEILNNINEIFNQKFTKNVELKLTQTSNTSNTTIIAGRTFESKTPGFYHLVGFSVGDSNLVAYNPRTKTFTNLAPGIKSATGGTANFPASYRAQDIYIIDEKLEEGTIIIPLSDGIADYLPQTVQTLKYPNENPKDDTDKFFYRQHIFLNEKEMKKLLKSLPKNAAVSDCLEKILQEALKNFEKIKQEKIKTAAEAEKKYKKIEQKIKTLNEKKQNNQIKEENFQKELRKLKEETEELNAKRIITVGDDGLIVGLMLATKEEIEFWHLSLLKAAINQQDTDSLKGFALQFSPQKLEYLLIKLEPTIKKELLEKAQSIFYQTFAEKADSGIIKREIIIPKSENNDNSTALLPEKSFLHEKNSEKSLRKVKIYSENEQTRRFTFFMKTTQLSKFEEKRQKYENELQSLQCKK